MDCKGNLKNEVKQDVSRLLLRTKATPGINITKVYSHILVFVCSQHFPKDFHLKYLFGELLGVQVGFQVEPTEILSDD